MLKIKHIPQYTYSDYKLWKGDWELIEGYPYAMSPSAFGEHQHIAGELFFQIKDQLKKNICKNNCFVYSELDWIVDNRNVVRPDLAVVCGERVEKFIENPPILIVEVLSESTTYRDRIVKKELYEINKVKYYLIADTENKAIEVFELVGNKYKLVVKNEFAMEGSCFISFNFNIIW